MLTLTPGQKYIDGSAGYSTLCGPYVRGEVGSKLFPWLGVYVAGQWTPKETRADGGFKVTW